MRGLQWQRYMAVDQSCWTHSMSSASMCRWLLHLHLQRLLRVLHHPCAAALRPRAGKRGAQPEALPCSRLPVHVHLSMLMGSRQYRSPQVLFLARACNTHTYIRSSVTRPLLAGAGVTNAAVQQLPDTPAQLLATKQGAGVIAHGNHNDDVRLCAGPAIGTSQPPPAAQTADAATASKPSRSRKRRKPVDEAFA